MSLTKLLKAPIKLFKKDVITFLIIRRYDLGLINEKLQYIAMRPNASISILRRKVWNLLDLPDYCDEIIVLKTQHDLEIPLTELRRGNNPQYPYILEVWLPGNRPQSTPITYNNMLTMGKDEERNNTIKSNDSYCDEKRESPEHFSKQSNYSISTETIAQIKHRVSNNMPCPEFKCKPDLSCKSKTSLFRIGGKKSQDNFTNILLKIQSDLTALNNKIAVLENKITS